MLWLGGEGAVGAGSVGIGGKSYSFDPKTNQIKLTISSALSAVNRAQSYHSGQRTPEKQDPNFIQI